MLASDYGYIANNFLVLREASCDGTADFGEPITRISIKDLIERGLVDLVHADFNHDGWLDLEDVSVFLSGGGGNGNAADRNH